MRLGAFVPVCLFAASLAAAPATTTPTPAPIPVPDLTAPHSRLSKAIHRNPSIVSDLDSRVLAALLASTTTSDFPVTIRTGDIGLCERNTCSVAVTIKLPDTAPPMRLAIAVSNSHGELSDVKHAECVTSQCTLQLVLERGRNTIAVGAGDSISQTAGVAITSVNAVPNVTMTAGGKMEWF